MFSDGYCLLKLKNSFIAKISMLKTSSFSWKNCLMRTFYKKKFFSINCLTKNFYHKCSLVLTEIVLLKNNNRKRFFILFSSKNCLAKNYKIYSLFIMEIDLLKFFVFCFPSGYCFIKNYKICSLFLTSLLKASLFP